jgi:hypothetical protein
VIASAEQLEKITDIVSRLDSNLVAEDADNRRRLPRVSMRTRMTLLILGGIAPTPVDVFSRNISSSGIGFVCKRMFRPEERVAIPIRIPRTPPKLLLARITFSRYIGGGLYEMGAEFLECVADISGSGPVERFIPGRWHQTPFHSPAPSNVPPPAPPPHKP